MTHKEALDYLKNRISKLELNHKIGNRDIAIFEVKEIVTGIKTHSIPIIEQALERAKKVEEELEKLKSWKNELSETIDNLINKTKHWEEKENKTEFEKGIARGYKTMLHQLLTNINEEELK